MKNFSISNECSFTFNFLLYTYNTVCNLYEGNSKKFPYIPLSTEGIKNIEHFKFSFSEKWNNSILECDLLDNEYGNTAFVKWDNSNFLDPNKFSSLFCSNEVGQNLFKQIYDSFIVWWTHPIVGKYNLEHLSNNYVQSIYNSSLSMSSSTNSDDTIKHISLQVIYDNSPLNCIQSSPSILIVKVDDLLDDRTRKEIVLNLKKILK